MFTYVLMSLCRNSSNVQNGLMHYPLVKCRLFELMLKPINHYVKQKLNLFSNKIFGRSYFSGNKLYIISHNMFNASIIIAQYTSSRTIILENGCQQRWMCIKRNPQSILAIPYNVVAVHSEMSIEPARVDPQPGDICGRSDDSLRYISCRLSSVSRKCSTQITAPLWSTLISLPTSVQNAEAVYNPPMIILSVLLMLTVFF